MTYEQAYQILNVNKQSSTEEIKSAYKAAAKKYHPDLYKGDKKVAEEKMKQINEAYSLLSQPHSPTTQRSTYSAPEERYSKECEDILWKFLNNMYEIQKEEREYQRKMRKIFKVILSLVLIAIIISHISLLGTTIKLALSSFIDSTWLLFGLLVLISLTSLASGIILSIAIISQLKK